jgi:hypothetical protein
MVYNCVYYCDTPTWVQRQRARQVVSATEHVDTYTHIHVKEGLIGLYA